METGLCQLCGQPAELVDGHVWPRFADKRYVSDPTSGGSFVDSMTGKITSKQHTRYWFCSHCDCQVLGQVEAYAANFCSDLDVRPTDVHQYDERLLIADML